MSIHEKYLVRYAIRFLSLIGCYNGNIFRTLLFFTLTLTPIVLEVLTICSIPSNVLQQLTNPIQSVFNFIKILLFVRYRKQIRSIFDLIDSSQVCVISRAEQDQLVRESSKLFDAICKPYAIIPLIGMTIRYIATTLHNELIFKLNLGIEMHRSNPLFLILGFFAYFLVIFSMVTSLAEIVLSVGIFVGLKIRLRMLRIFIERLGSLSDEANEKQLKEMIREHQEMKRYT